MNPTTPTAPLHAGRIVLDALRAFAGRYKSPPPMLYRNLSATDARDLLYLIDALSEALQEMVGTHCSMENGTLNSFAVRSHADALRLLAALDLITITHSTGRLVMSEWNLNAKLTHGGPTQ